MGNEDYKHGNNVRRFNRKDVLEALRTKRTPIKLAVTDMDHRIGIGSQSKFGFEIKNDPSISQSHCAIAIDRTGTYYVKALDNNPAKIIGKNGSNTIKATDKDEYYIFNPRAEKISIGNTVLTVDPENQQITAKTITYDPVKGSQSEEQVHNYKIQASSRNNSGQSQKKINKEQKEEDRNKTKKIFIQPTSQNSPLNHIPNQTIKIGRAHQVGHYDDYHAVSRDHLEIKFKDGRVIITDLKSNNGTLITKPEEHFIQSPKTKTSIEFKQNQAITIQLGKIIIEYLPNEKKLIGKYYGDLATSSKDGRIVLNKDLASSETK